MKIQILITSMRTGSKAFSNKLMRTLWDQRLDIGADHSAGFSIKSEFPGHGVERITIEATNGEKKCLSILEELGLKRVNSISDTKILVQKTGDKAWLAIALECYSDIAIKPDYKAIAQAIEGSKQSTGK